MNTRDRAFEAGIVADRADAADVRATPAPASDEVEETQQRRGDLVELADVGRAGILQLFRSDRAHRHRHVGQRLVAARRGDDDVAGVDRLLFARLVLDGGGFSGRALCRLRGLLVGVGV